MTPEARPRALPLLAALALTACADGPGDALGPPSLDAFEEKVVRGELTRERPEVGSISVGCTATLVAPEVGLSAAHCFSYGSREQPGRYGTFTIETATGGERRFTIERYVSFSGDLGAADLALFRLTEAVPPDVARPAPLAMQKPGTGTTLTVFGYGCTQRNTSTDWRKRKASFPMGTNTNHLCPGDSGGPVFDTSTGAVLRVNSGYFLDGFGTDIFGDVAQHHGALAAKVAEWSATGSPAPGDPQAGPDSSGEVCGFHRATRKDWTCSADGAARERCVKGHAPEREACAAGCEATAGVPAQCADATRTRACGPAYAPYDAWTCTSDGGHVLRCAGGQLEVAGCFVGCAPGAWTEPEACR